MFEIENKDGVSARFSLNRFNELTNCQLICTIPIILLRNGTDLEAMLRMELNLKEPILLKNHTNAILSITIDNQEISSNKVQHFEPGLYNIKEALPDDYKLKCCYSCAFADYSVYGMGFFGTLACYKNIKEDYLKLQDKEEYMDIMDNYDRLVQETYLCNEFAERKKGTGYRG